MKLYTATQNPHKIREIRERIRATNPSIELLGLQELGQVQELAEDFETLEENAFQKAEFIANTFHVSCFADDTGLEVEALNGAPGVYSARYAGDQKNDVDNIRLLLKNLENQSNRKAQFRTVIALILDEKKYQFEGIIKGKIIEQSAGNQGFGYDPVFVPDGYSQTFAQMPFTEKNRISHRAKAIDKLIDFLQKIT